MYQPCHVLQVISHIIIQPPHEKYFEGKEKCFQVMLYCLPSVTDCRKGDMFEIIGKTLASNLRILPWESVIARKIISDVLYETKLSSLKRNSQLPVNDP
jgi:hypothetical protein